MNEPLNDAISLTLTDDGKQHVLHEAQLEELRLLAVTRMMQEGGDYSAFGEELQRAELWQMAGSIRFGSWIFEQRDGQLMLVRNPPRGPVMRMVLVAFALEDGQWAVRAVSEQRVMAR